jgi:threonine dehydrogenase-like Zn-dependent dehydrogenase
MRGLVFPGDGRVELRDFPDPTPGPGDVVIEVKASGLCGTDLHRYRRTADQVDADGGSCIAGHEPAGVVAAVGPGVRPTVAQVGDRVMVHHYSGCAQCVQCRSGWPQLCDRQRRLAYGHNAHGAHAPLLRVPAETVIPLREELSYLAGATIGCGTGTAWGGIERVGDLAGRTIAVFGQGPVGLSTTMLASALGATVIAVDLGPARLALARRFGAALTVDASEVDSAEEIRAMTGGRGVAAAFETSGSTSAAESMLSVLGTWATGCYLGLGGSVAFEPQSVLNRQLTLKTSWSMSIVGQARCADFIAERGLPVDELFTHQWALGQAADAYEHFARQDAGKAAFVF